jgi:hypothetical protein
VAAADLDGDGAMDLILARADGVSWLQSTAGDGSTWQERSVDAAFSSAESVTVSDVDGDGDLDLVGGSRGLNEVIWWENQAGDGTAWDGHMVGNDFYGAYAVRCEDLDGDGDMDILGAANTADTITWWENRTGSGSSWSEHTVSGAFDGALAVAIADVDGDGDSDVLGAAINADTIAWWQNGTPRQERVAIAAVLNGGNES